MIKNEHAVEMIRFVLHHLCPQAIRVPFDPFAVRIETGDVNA